MKILKFQQNYDIIAFSLKLLDSVFALSKNTAQKTVDAGSNHETQISPKLR